MKHLVIGDIHGCFDELRALLDRAGPGEGDQIIALGDAVDRGPDSKRVLDFLRTTPGACSILGNHERKHLRSFNGEIRPALSQKITRRQLGEQAYPDVCAFMETFPRHLVLDEAVLVHGYLEPDLPLEEQRDTVVIGTLSGQRHLEPLSRPWYELYQGDRPVICGHHDYLLSGQAMVFEDRVFCLDTSCCRGGALTGLLLPEFRLVSVKARRDYWRETQDRYPDLRFGGEYDQTLAWDKIDLFLEAATGRRDLDPHFLQRLAQLKQTRQRAEQQMATLLSFLQQKNEQLLSALRAEGPFDELPPREQGSAYARMLAKNDPLSGWLHLARRGLLDLNAVHQRLRTPEQVFNLIQKLGI